MDGVPVLVSAPDQPSSPSPSVTPAAAVACVLVTSAGIVIAIIVIVTEMLDTIQRRYMKTKTIKLYGYI